MTTRSKIRFKEITSQQSVLFPSNISDRIATNHPVRIVNQIVDQLNIDDILFGYKGGGTSSYHPRMMIQPAGFHLMMILIHYLIFIHTMYS